MQLNDNPMNVSPCLVHNIRLKTKLYCCSDFHTILDGINDFGSTKLAFACINDHIKKVYIELIIPITYSNDPTLKLFLLLFSTKIYK